MIRAVLFDVDGTLIDSVDAHAEAWQRTFGHFGFSDLSYPEIRNQIGKGSDKLVSTLVGEDVWKTRGEEIKNYRAELFQREYLPKVKPFPRVRELFQRVIASGRRVALATSAVGEELEAYTRMTNVADLLHARTSADDAKESKPAPDIFQAALDRVGARGEEAVVVGDTRFDAEAACKAGATPVGMLAGGFPEADLRAAGCVEIYRDPEDLLRRYDASLLGAR
jgi:HAD superfamily hydrolase (TIGR01509 family)